MVKIFGMLNENTLTASSFNEKCVLCRNQNNTNDNKHDKKELFHFRVESIY